MTDEQTNQLFAEKIWGWIGYYKEGEGWWINSIAGPFLVKMKDYTPSTNFLQAFEALEKFCRDKDYTFDLRWNRQESTCSVFSPKRNTATGLIACKSDTFEVATICGALVQALKAKP
jgi:hypothetical protein